MSNSTLSEESADFEALEVESWGATDVGRRRTTNEDRLYRDPDHGVFAVADGIGGKPGGEEASQTIVDQLSERAGEIRRFVETRSAPLTSGDRAEVFEFLFETLQSINREVYRRGTPSKFPRGIGSTLDMVVVAPVGAFILHVGDSRVYLIRDGDIFRITRDHTFDQHLREKLDDRPAGISERYAHVLTRSIGSEPRVEVDRSFVDLRPDDRLLLCSDGVTRHLAGAEILEVLNEHPDQEGPNRLIEEANERGGEDNATAVLLRAAPPPERDFSSTPTRPDTFRKVHFLTEMELFEDLGFPALMTVLGYVQSSRYSHEELVIARGDTVDGLYFVMEGRLKVEVEGREVTTIGEGDHFGEFALFGEPSRSADVRAIDDCQVLFMPKRHLDRLVDETPDLGTTILKRLLARTSEVIQQMLADRY